MWIQLESTIKGKMNKALKLKIGEDKARFINQISLKTIVKQFWRISTHIQKICMEI